MSCQEVQELVLLSWRKDGSNLEKKGVSIVISGAVCVLQIAKKDIVAQHLVISTWKGRSTVPEISCEVRWISVFPCHAIDSNSICFCRRSCRCNLRLETCKECPWPVNATSVFVTLPIGGLTDLLSRRTKKNCQVKVQWKSVFKAANATFFCYGRWLLNSISAIMMQLLWILTGLFLLPFLKSILRKFHCQNCQ